MEDDNDEWGISWEVRIWTRLEGLAKLDRLPGRFELTHGKLCFHESERLTVMAGLLENLGIDAAQPRTAGDTSLVEFERRPFQRLTGVQETWGESSWPKCVRQGL